MEEKSQKQLEKEKKKKKGFLRKGRFKLKKDKNEEAQTAFRKLSKKERKAEKYMSQKDK